MVSSPASSTADAHKRQGESKKENDLHKSIIQCWSSSAVMLAACRYSSIVKGARWQPHLIKGCGSLTFHVKKDRHWVTQFFFSSPPFSSSVQGKSIGIQICDCYCEQMSPLASKGNGTSRPTLTPGAKQHTTTGLQRGKRDSFNKWMLHKPALQTPFPFSAIIIKEHLFVVPQAPPLHKCPSLTLTHTFNCSGCYD